MAGTVSPLPGGRPPYEIPSGTVRLFKHDNWESDSLDLKVDGEDTNTPNVEYNIAGHWMNDNATWAAFNLPKGVVVTLQEHRAARVEVVNLANCGKVVDLVGTGQTEGVDLWQCDFNDNMSAWFWRNVNLELGAVELYVNANYEYPRTVIFLSDWVPRTIHGIYDWGIQDSCSAVKWHTIDDRVTCMLWDDVGSGSSNLLAGYNKLREIPYLGTQDMNDNISSFKWDSLIPQKEIITPLQIPVNIDMNDAKVFTSSMKFKNDTDVEEEFSVELHREDAETLTVTTTDATRAGFSSSLTYSLEAGLEGGVTVSSTLNVTISYDYTRTESTEKSNTKTTSLTFKKNFKASPRKTTVGSLTVKVGTVRRTPFETTARRWYYVQVPGSERDVGNQGLYVREETVKGFLEGGLRGEVEIRDYYVD